MEQTLPQETTAPAPPKADLEGTHPAMDPRAYLHGLVDTLPEAMVAPLARVLEAELRYRSGLPVDASDEQRWH